MTDTLHPKPQMGIYDKPYWDFAQKRELRLQKCASCGRFRYPPGPACPHCLSDEYEWCALSGRGRLVSSATFHRQYLPEFPVPYVVVSIETEEGPLLVGQLRNKDGAAISVGTPMRAIFDVVETADGPWRICQWEPDPNHSDTHSARRHSR